MRAVFAAYGEFRRVRRGANSRFQRNFVWDIGRASRLIESLILGLPVPQLFPYSYRTTAGAAR